MRPLIFALLATACLLPHVSMGAGADSPPEVPAVHESDRVFGLTRVWKIHLRVSAENWKAMQPTQGGMPGFGRPPFERPVGGPAGAATPQSPRPVSDRTPEPGKSTPQKPNETSAPDPARRPAAPATPPHADGRAPGAAGPGPAFRPGSFGYEFEYVKATVELDGEQFADVGLRFKGNGTYMLSAASRKRPFKLDFNRYVDDQRFHGLQQLNLHNNVMDPTGERQALSYPVFAEAGIPSPRTAFAEVTLTIDGECERERLGLYTLVEEIDKAFLKRHFPSAKGMLLKPEGTQGLEYKGEDWADYAWYEPKSKPKKSETRRLIDALRLIHKADDDRFREEIGEYLDLDEFARFLAANTLLANMDSFLTHVHNYYLYLPPESNKFVILPWDMDLSMGAFFLAGSAEQLQDLSISHPHMGDNKLLDRLLAWEDFNRRYRDHLRRLTETCFGDNGLTTKSLPQVRATIKDLIAEDSRQAAATPQPRGPGGMFGAGPPVETFLVKRRESILAQLAGTSQGRRPAMGFGPPPGGPRPGAPGGGFGGGAVGPGNFHGEQILRLADTDKNQKLSRQEFLDVASRWMDSWDMDKNDLLNSEEIRAGLNESLGPPPNAAGGFKPPPGFGPGMFLGQPLLKLADADMDGSVSKDEWTRLFETWFEQWDTTGDKSLGAAELIAGLNKAFAPPPGFGPPGLLPRDAGPNRPNAPPPD